MYRLIIAATLFAGLQAMSNVRAEKIVVTLTIPNAHGTISTAAGPGVPFTADSVTLSAMSDTSALDSTFTKFNAPIQVQLSGLPSGVITDPAAAVSIEPNGNNGQFVYFTWPALFSNPGVSQGAFAQYIAAGFNFLASFTPGDATAQTFSSLTTGGQFGATLSDGRIVSVGAGPAPATLNVAVGDLPFYYECYGSSPLILGLGLVSPAHAGPTDTIAYTVNLPFALVSSFTPQTRIFSKTTVGTINQGGANVQADIVIGTDGTSLPGYEVAASAVDDYYGHLGPLPVGTYHVTPTVRVAPADGSGFETVCPQHSVTSLVGVFAQPGATVTSAAIEYYWPAKDHYFVTANAAEIAALDGGATAGWVRTGQTFDVYLPSQSNQRGRPVSRYYGLPSAGLDSHFYSASVAENRAVQQAPFRAGWLQESSDVFEIATPNTLTGVCPAATTPVYRLWNNRPDSNHRYTADITTRQQMIAQGFIPEGYGPLGVVFCAATP